MALTDRQDVVSIVEETHGLIGNSLATDVPQFMVIRFDVAVRLQELIPQPLVDDLEMLSMMRRAFFTLIENVASIQAHLLGPEGESFDTRLSDAGLTGSLLAIKTTGFRRELDGVLEQSERLPRKRRFRRALKWANIVLGSLASIPVVGPIAEPLKEYKESVEAQVDNESDN